MTKKERMKCFKIVRRHTTTPKAYQSLGLGGAAIVTYRLGETYSVNGPIEICFNGYHAYKSMAQLVTSINPACLDDERVEVLEVELWGNVEEMWSKVAARNMTVIRTVPKKAWRQGLDSNCNSGDYNTGFNNVGNRNTGNRNVGHSNTGCGNAGSYNTNSGNAGSHNTGINNTGDRNSGCANTGDGNTGDWNTGDHNTGDHNTGDGNTGDYNIGDNCTGYGNVASIAQALCSEPHYFVLDIEVTAKEYHEVIHFLNSKKLNSLQAVLTEVMASITAQEAPDVLMKNKDKVQKLADKVTLLTDKGINNA